MKILQSHPHDKDFNCPNCNIPLDDQTEYHSFDEGIGNHNLICPSCNYHFSVSVNTTRTYTITTSKDWEYEINQVINEIKNMSDEEFIRTCREFGYDPLPNE